MLLHRFYNCPLSLWLCRIHSFRVFTRFAYSPVSRIHSFRIHSLRVFTRFAYSLVSYLLVSRIHPFRFVVIMSQLSSYFRRMSHQSLPTDSKCHQATTEFTDVRPTPEVLEISACDVDTLHWFTTRCNLVLHHLHITTLADHYCHIISSKPISIYTTHGQHNTKCN